MYLSEDKEVYIDEPNPHKDTFCIYWDNDVVNLSRKEAKILVLKLQNWLNETNWHINT